MGQIVKYKTKVELDGNQVEVTVRGRYYAASRARYEMHGPKNVYNPADFELLDVTIPSEDVIDGYESVLDMISDEEAERIVEEYLEEGDNNELDYTGDY